MIVLAALAVGLSFGMLSVSSTVPREAQAQTPEAQPAPGTGERKRKGGGGSGTLVEVDRVKIVPMAQTLPLVGRLVAVWSGAVAAVVDGPVAEMRANIGDKVKKGEVLATLATDRLRWDRDQKAAELAAAEAVIATAKARLSLAEQELRRMQELETSAAFSKARFEDKRLEVVRLRAEIVESQAKAEKARAVLRLAETDLSYARIVAPYDGTVTRRLLAVGAFVKEGEPVFQMVSDRDLEIEVDVPATRVGVLSPGTVATFQIGADGPFEAVVRAVVPEEDLRTRTRTVRFTPKFPARPELLAANQSVAVQIPLGGGRNVLSVHKDAITMSRGVATAFVVDDGRVQLRNVQVGESVGRRFEVLSGLREGDIVVTRGNERLRDGERVRYNGVPTQ